MWCILLYIVLPGRDKRQWWGRLSVTAACWLVVMLKQTLIFGTHKEHLGCSRKSANVSSNLWTFSGIFNFNTQFLFRMFLCIPDGQINRKADRQAETIKAPSLALLKDVILPILKCIWQHFTKPSIFDRSDHVLLYTFWGLDDLSDIIVGKVILTHLYRYTTLIGLLVSRH